VYNGDFKRPEKDKIMFSKLKRCSKLYACKLTVGFLLVWIVAISAVRVFAATDTPPAEEKQNAPGFRRLESVSINDLMFDTVTLITAAGGVGLFVLWLAKDQKDTRERHAQHAAKLEEHSRAFERVEQKSRVQDVALRELEQAVVETRGATKEIRSSQARIEDAIVRLTSRERGDNRENS